MSSRKINDIAENFACYTTTNASPLDAKGNLQYYFAGSIATMLTCNATMIEDIDSKKEKITVNDEDRKFLQNHFPRQTGDIDIITIDKEASIQSFSSDRASLSSRRIKEAIPDAGDFCKFFASNMMGNMFWDNLSYEHKITHRISKIKTEQGNFFYVPRPDYQLANKICEVAVLNFDDSDKNRKNIRDISIMFSAFSKMYSNEELLNALSVCLKDREENRDIAIGQSAKACFRKLAPKMKDYLINNIPDSGAAIVGVQNMLNYIEKPLCPEIMRRTCSGNAGK